GPRAGARVGGVRPAGAGGRRPPPGPHAAPGPAHGGRDRPWILRRRPAPRAAVAVRDARPAVGRGAPDVAGGGGGGAGRGPGDRTATDRRAPAQARRALHGPRAVRHSVPPVRRRPPARLLRVPRGHVLPGVPDRRQGPGRPPPEPPA